VNIMSGFPTKTSAMSPEALFAVFANFNDHVEEPPAAPVEEAPPAIDETIQIRQEAWTEGYLAGRQEQRNEIPGAKLTAKLLTALDDLAATTAQEVDAAALTVADLLISTVISAVAEQWPANLLNRVRMVADRIKPALTVTPEFVLRDDDRTERRFADIDSLARALDEGIVGEDVTIRWHRGEATISRETLLKDLRDAAIPLSAGLVNEQNSGPPS
jgi:flagellar biosynthesis/type III secretory pathway protein FliH